MFQEPSLPPSSGSDVTLDPNGSLYTRVKGWLILAHRHLLEGRVFAKQGRPFSHGTWTVIKIKSPPKHRLTFNGLHGVISHNIELFITAAVRTSNPAWSKYCFINSDL
jgi:hypothetical protein